jgi:hypothetical protein
MMTIDDIKNKNLVLCNYLQSIFEDYKVKAEFSTNDNDVKVITVQEETGNKIVFYGDVEPLNNYFNIDIFGDNIQEQKNTSVLIGNLIGKLIITEFNNQKWQIIFMQVSNPRAIQYMDIRRVSYNLTLKTIINRIG